jgi:hypothetical protein
MLLCLFANAAVTGIKSERDYVLYGILQVMKALLCVPLLFASYAFASEAAEHIAMGRVITTLNKPLQYSAIPGRDRGTGSPESAVNSCRGYRPDNLLCPIPVIVCCARRPAGDLPQ